MEQRAWPDEESRAILSKHITTILGLSEEETLTLVDPEDQAARFDPLHVGEKELEFLYLSIPNDHSRNLHFDGHLACCLVFGDEDGRLVEGGTKDGAERLARILDFSRAFDKYGRTPRYKANLDSVMESIASEPPPSGPRSKRPTYAYRPLSFRHLDFLLFQMTSFLSLQHEYDRLIGVCAERLVPSEEYKHLFELLLGPTKESWISSPSLRDRNDKNAHIELAHGGTARAQLLVSTIQRMASELSKACDIHPLLLIRKLDELSEATTSTIQRVKRDIVSAHNLPDNRDGVHFPKKDRAAADTYARMVRRRMPESGLAKLDEPKDTNRRARLRGNFSLDYKHFLLRTDHWPTKGSLQFFHTPRTDDLRRLCQQT